MKILFILHLPPPVHGPATVGGYIKKSLVINTTFNCSYINLGLSVTIDEIGGNIIGKVSRYLSLIWKVKKQLIFHRPDLCYLSLNAQGPGFYKDAIIALLVRLFGIKIVFHFHNKGITTHKTNFFENILYRLVLNNCDIILISERLYYDFREYVPEDRVHYCTNGIPEGIRRQATGNVAQSSELRTQGLAGEVHGTQNITGETNKVCQLLFLSNLIESKGIFILLEACRILHDKKLNFQCTVVGGVGDVSLQEFNSKVTESGLNDCIKYTGKKHGEDKEDAFIDADIFVHPSYLDCLPLVILEAMQHSLPVVSTFEGAIPDAVEDGITGFLVPKKDPVTLAHKLEILIKDPVLRDKMGAAGRAKYELEFTLDRFEKRLKEILLEIGGA